MIPLVAPCVTGHDRQYVRQRVADGLLEDESEVRRFEEAFADRVGCKGAVAVCSGTVALELALEVLNPAAMDYGMVHIPSYVCTAMQNAAGDRSVSYLDSSFDVKTARMTLDPIGDAVDPLVIVAHMFGQPTTRDVEIRIEDWTLSLGITVPLWGRVGVCSTHASKMISTGRGGLVFSNDTALLERVRELVEERSVAMSSTQAALGVSQLDQFDAFVARRQEIAALYSERFSNAGIECPAPDSGSVFFRYLVGVEDPEAKVAALALRGVEAGRGVFPPLHRLAGLSDDDFPGATACVNRLLSVPCHPSITDKQAAYIAEQVVEVCAP